MTNTPDQSRLEAAARAFHEAQWGDGSWAECSPSIKLHVMDYMQAALAAADAQGWRPIAEAPEQPEHPIELYRERTLAAPRGPIVAISYGKIKNLMHSGKWSGWGYSKFEGAADEEQPTHWRWFIAPLPAPPKEST